MTSMAPLSVDGLMEFHAVETESLRLRTYCIVLSRLRLRYVCSGEDEPGESGA